MSEFLNSKGTRIIKLFKLFHAISEQNNVVNAVKNNQDLINKTIPSDIIVLVDFLVKSKIPIDTQYQSGLK